MKQHEKSLKALANGRRLAIVAYLKKEREAMVSDIAEQIRLSFRSTSKHLAVLTASDILDKEQRSAAVFYSLAPKLSPMARSVINLL